MILGYDPCRIYPYRESDVFTDLDFIAASFFVLSELFIAKNPNSFKN